jgi:protocatechuate 3,4-dioxygenase beta subunit
MSRRPVPVALSLAIALAGCAATAPPAAFAQASPSDGRPERPLVLAGRVITEAGKPLAGAEVRYTPYAPPVPVANPGAGTVTLTTGADGEFRIDRIDSPGSVVLIASKPGYVTRAVERLMGIDRRPPEIVLHEAASVSGQVLGAAGRPVPGATVFPASAGARGQFTPVTTDAAGRFEVLDAWPGRLELAAQAPGYVRSLVESVDVEAGGHEEVFLRLSPPFSLAGRLVDREGAPIERARVWVDPDWQGVITGADGTFEIDGLPEHGVELRIQVDNRPPISYPVVVDRDGAQATISPFLGAIRGRLLSHDGSPAGRKVFTLEPLGSGRPRKTDNVYGVTRPDGSFDLDRMPPGVYRLRVRSEGSSDASHGWPVPRLIEVAKPALPGAEPEVTEVAVRLPAPTVIKLRLSGPRAEGLTPEDVASVGLVLANPETRDKRTVEPGAFGPDGTYDLGPLEPGTWVVLAIVGTRDLGALEQVVVDPGSEELVVDLELKTRAEIGGS